MSGKRQMASLRKELRLMAATYQIRTTVKVAQMQLQSTNASFEASTIHASGVLERQSVVPLHPPRQVRVKQRNG